MKICQNHDSDGTGDLNGNSLIEATLNPSLESLEVINQGVHEFNLKHLGDDVIDYYFRIGVVAKDSKCNVVGRVHGDLVWEWLHIDTLWVDEKYRNQEIGSSLLEKILSETALKGFFVSHLETTDFQAVDFYQKNGSEIFGKLEGKPEGNT